MSDEALRQRRRNLSKARLRSDRESRTIKLLIWQACFEGRPRPPQRALARKLGVWPSYVWKVQRKALSEGMDALLQHGKEVTLDDVAEARRFSTRMREQEPSLLAPAPQPASANEPRALTADESIAERWREAREEQRKNPPRRRGPRSFSSVSPRLLPQLADDIW